MATSEPVREKGVHFASSFLRLYNRNADVSEWFWVVFAQIIWTMPDARFRYLCVNIGVLLNLGWMSSDAKLMLS